MFLDNTSQRVSERRGPSLQSHGGFFGGVGAEAVSPLRVVMVS